MDTRRADTQGEQSRVSPMSVPNAPTTPAGLDLSPQVVSIMTTEHYNLQAGRAMTVADASGRASLYLGTVSTTLVALAFIGGVSHTANGLGQAFHVCALVLFPSLVFLGGVTFARVLQSAIEDAVYAREINRIRHLYQELAPDMQPYFILSAHDDHLSVMGNMAMGWGWWQVFLTTAGMIAVINSVIMGTFVGLLIWTLHSSLPMGATVAVGAAAFLASVALLQFYQWQRWQRHWATASVRFPASLEDSPADGSRSGASRDSASLKS